MVSDYALSWPVAVERACSRGGSGNPPPSPRLTVILSFLNITKTNIVMHVYNTLRMYEYISCTFFHFDRYNNMLLI